MDFDIENIPEGLLDSDEFFQKYVKLDEKEATRLGRILESFKQDASQDEKDLAKTVVVTFDSVFIAPTKFLDWLQNHN